MTAGVGQDDLSADNTQVTGVVPGTGVPGTNVATGTSSVNGTTVAGQYGELKIGADGSYVYTLDNALPATQALNQGQQVLETFTYTITDADGDASNTTITVTINGTNDVPVVTNLPAATAGSVSEAGHLDDGTVVAGTATATGDLNASDVDSGATQTWGLQGTPSTTYGSMAIDSSTGVLDLHPGQQPGRHAGAQGRRGRHADLHGPRHRRQRRLRSTRPSRSPSTAPTMSRWSPTCRRPPPAA